MATDSADYRALLEAVIEGYDSLAQAGIAVPLGLYDPIQRAKVALAERESNDG